MRNEKFMNTNMDTTPPRPTPETNAEARKCHGIPDGFNLPEFSYVTSAFASKARARAG
jgi:hypothetical protein